MSTTVSVVQYQGSPQKMNVLQQQQQHNNREVIILRKQPQPQQQPQVKDILVTNTARKKGTRSGEKVAQNPPPIAVARRNARERNRVKQVNNGFATLRQHIPNSIAAAYESGGGRGGNKKLSKVETLRMAVEYIRSLEDMLANEDNDASTSYVSSTPSSPALTTTVTMSYAYPSNDEDDLSQSSHYTRNYFYEDSENLDPIEDNIDIDLGHQDLSLLNSMHKTTGSLSPEMYSDSSLSPISLERSDRQIYIAAYNSPKLRISPELMTEIKSEPPVLSLENDTDLPVDSKENMIEVMAWWEQQQTRS